MGLQASTLRAAVSFVLLLGALSLGFWLAGAALGSLEPLIGVNLPFSALQAVAPAIAATAIATCTGQLATVRRRLRLLPRQPWLWTLALAVPVLVVFLPRGGGWRASDTDLVAVVALTSVYLVAAAAEETGWTGFLLPMLARLNDLQAGLVIGTLWSAWHIVGYAQAGNPCPWIVGQCVFTVAFRVFLVRMARASGGAVWPVVLAHASYNVSWSITSVSDDGYHPWYAAPAMAAVTVAIFFATRSSPASGSQIARSESEAAS